MVDLPPWKILYSQIGSSSQLGRGKQKNVPNHQPVLQRNPVCLVCLELAELRCTCVRNLTARTRHYAAVRFQTGESLRNLGKTHLAQIPKDQGAMKPWFPKFKNSRDFFGIQPFSSAILLGIFIWIPKFEPCSKCLTSCLTSWHQIRKCLRHCAQVLLTRAHRFCWCAYLFLRGAYAGLHGPQFCLHHTLTRGPLLNMNTTV